MKDNKMIVNCTYSDTELTPEELILESFQLFLQKELFTFAISQPV